MIRVARIILKSGCDKAEKKANSYPLPNMPYGSAHAIDHHSSALIGTAEHAGWSLPKAQPHEERGDGVIGKQWCSATAQDTP
jgi:hypothetical protein